MREDGICDGSPVAVEYEEGSWMNIVTVTSRDIGKALEVMVKDEELLAPKRYMQIIFSECEKLKFMNTKTAYLYFHYLYDCVLSFVALAK